MKTGLLTRLLICFAIAAVTLGVYWQVTSHEFTYTFDDDQYVLENSHVLSGLNAESVRWAFTSAGYASNWHPLTWISHMADVQFFGANKPGYHHLVSVVLHIFCALLLFILLDRVTHSPWKSAFVAAIFAIHPLHVESVAWVAERKDVLSTFFMMLAILAYVRYAERPGVLRYTSVALLFALGLLAKPMLVTLPVLLILLDYWPLERNLPFGRLLREKLPLFAMAIASAAMTLVAQRGGGAVATFDVFPLPVRLENALVSYVGYLVKMVWPAGLAVYYPHPGSTIPVWQVAGSAVILVVISVCALRLRERFPVILFGWLWYVITLVPVIGLVQVGGQAMADRYTYVPLIGVFAALAWTLPAALAKRVRPAVFAVPAGASLVALSVVTFAQVGYWKTPETLFARAIAVTDPDTNGRAHMNMAVALSIKGKTDEAIVHYCEAVRIMPRFVDARNNLGLALLEKGDTAGARDQFTTALGLDPNSAAAHADMAMLFEKTGQLTQAADYFRRATELDPGMVRAHFSLGLIQQRTGDLPGAVESLTRACELSPTEPIIANTLAWIYATCPDGHYRNGEEAVRLADIASRASNYEDPSILDTLAAAYAEAGRFDLAVETAENAVARSKSLDLPQLTSSVSARLNLYRSGKAYRENR